MLDFDSWSALTEAIAFDPYAKYPDPLFGFTIGTVDSAQAMTGGDGGNWGGSMPRALWFGRLATDFMKARYPDVYKNRNVVSSQKRTRVNTASGNVSDHYQGNTDAYAVDLSTAGNAKKDPAAKERGDSMLAHLMQAFGHPEYKGGSWFNVTKNGYRYQVGWLVANHYDHIHVGVQKTTAKDSVSAIPAGSVASAETSSAATVIAGNTFAEKLFNNPMFKQWSNVTMPGGSANLQLKDVEYALARPGAKAWFMHSFNLDASGNRLGDSGSTADTAASAVTTGSLDSTGAVASGSTGKVLLKANFDDVQKNNISLMIDYMNKSGITDPLAQIGILSVISKESGFKPKSEVSYATTANSRIKKIFGSRVAKYSDAELNALKSDPEKFFNLVYAKTVGNQGGGDGWKYRGRGFNQLTGKKNYEKYGNMIGRDLVNNPDLVNDPKVAAEVAIKFFTKGKTGEVFPKFKDKVEAATYFADVNAGGGVSSHRQNAIAASEKFDVAGSVA
jgi:predicted chitinase